MSFKTHFKRRVKLESVEIRSEELKRIQDNAEVLNLDVYLVIINKRK
jgi:hypothetical protein